MKISNIVLITIALFSLNAHAELSPEEINIINNQVYEKLVKENYLKFNRVTKQGVISACELEFQNAYRDFRGKQGFPVIINGSFSLQYVKGKNLVYALKILPSVADASFKKWNILTPVYTNISIKNESLEKYKTIDFNCEMGGKCSGYNDKEVKISGLVLDNPPLDAEITLTLDKDGADYSFNLSSISGEIFDKERMKFNLCALEISEKFMTDLKELIKK